MARCYFVLCATSPRRPCYLLVSHNPFARISKENRRIQFSRDYLNGKAECLILHSWIGVFESRGTANSFLKRMRALKPDSAAAGSAVMRKLGASSGNLEMFDRSISV